MARIPYDVRGVQPFDPNDKHSPFPIAPAELSETEREAIRRRVDKYRYPLYSVDELGAFPPVSYLIEGRLAAGEMTCLYGKGGTYKSFVALGWSCQLAAAGHGVVYIAAEGASGLRARVAAWQKRHGAEDLSGLRIMPENVNLQVAGDVDTWVKEITDQLGDRSVSLVVIDTLARNFVGGNESDPKDMGLFVEGCETIRRQFATATLVIHHSAKNDRQERGTESLRNASFAMFRVERKAGSGTIATLDCDRIKEAEQPPKMDLRLELIDLPELGDGVSSLALADSSVTAAPDSDESADEYSSDERKVLSDALRTNRRTNRRRIERKLGCGKSKAASVLKSLLNAGLLQAEGKGKNLTYRVTEKGAKAVGEK